MKKWKERSVTRTSSNYDGPANSLLLSLRKFLYPLYLLFGWSVCPQCGHTRAGDASPNRESKTFYRCYRCSHYFRPNKLFS